MIVLRIVTALLVGLSLAACVRSGLAPAPVRPPVAAPPSPPPAASAPVRSAPAWPALDREPELGVRIDKGESVRVRLLVAHRSDEGVSLPAGTYDVSVQGADYRFGTRTLTGPRPGLDPIGGGAAFQAGGIRCSGRLLLSRSGREVEVIERVGVETWLAGVLPAEMSPTWPAEALAAQAIVARSYAAARWQARSGEAWHVVRGTADVAYEGVDGSSPVASEAIRRTRGELLIHDGQAVLARFHACSGGRTEDSAALWPGATLVDGRTPLARFMQPVDDPASVEGARGLGWTRTHQQWRVALPTAEIGTALRTWSAKSRGRPQFGEVHAVRIAATQPSGRVERVAIVHRGPAGEITTELPGLDFRLIVGANKLRSLWWEKAVMAAGHGGELVVEGRGFGHGVGLPQLSAWHLANDGCSGEDIVARYYPGATLARVWR